MLIIVMHSNQDYLRELLSLMHRENITDVTIIKKEGIGSYLIGEGRSFLSRRGRFSNDYDRALVAVIKGEEKARHLLDLMENDDSLGSFNLEDKGFICTMPFQQIKNLELESSSVKREFIEVKLGDYLKEKRILLNLKARSKEESIKEIAALLENAKDMVDFKTFLKDVFEREKLSTTGIGSEIAIPHARSDAVKGFVIAFGRSQEGVEFNSLDGKPAKLIFLLGTPKKETQHAYLKILARLTRLLQKESFRSSLLKASSPKEILDEFKRVEK